MYYIYRVMKTSAKAGSKFGLIESHKTVSLLLVALPLFAISRIQPNLLIVLLQGRHVLASLGELTFLHAFADVPVDKGALGVHQIELVVQPGPGFSNGCGVGEHADCTLHLSQVTARNHRGWLVVDADLEASRAPVHELHATLALDGGDGGVDILGHYVAPIEHAAGHVLAVPWVTLHHGIGWLEAGVSDLGDAQGLMVGLLCRDDGRISD